ncbi:MAG: hypothetical protein KC486_20945 [Myxococcales bacterium]|nr:hypothetical protein [Myxococcales bacterium]
MTDEQQRDEPESADTGAASAIDVSALIVGDLERRRRDKRRHFLPALLLVVLFVGGSLAFIGVRADLLDQPLWQLALQLLLWILCFLIFPAIGLGLLFPRRTTRVLLAVTAVATTVVAAVGQGLSDLASLSDHLAGEHGLGCGAYMIGAGMVLLAIGYLSGAFVQRRRPAAVFWITAGVALASLNLVTWHCPATGLAHLLPGHLGGAAILLILASVVASIAHLRESRARG